LNLPARRHISRISAYAQRAAKRVSDAAFSTNRRATAPQPGFSDPEFDDPAGDSSRNGNSRQNPTAVELRERFEALDERAKAIEEFVSSVEYRLEKEFRGIKD